MTLTVTLAECPLALAPNRRRASSVEDAEWVRTVPEVSGSVVAKVMYMRSMIGIGPCQLYMTLQSHNMRSCLMDLSMVYYLQM